MKYALVTTFHPKGYENYGRKMMATFAEYWPKNIRLYAYWEKVQPSEHYDNVTYVDLLASCPDLVRFLERNKDNPKDNSFKVVQYYEQGAAYNDPRDAGMRCSFKSFCMFDAAERIDTDWIVWVDADTFTFKKIPDDFLSKMLPDDALVAYLGVDNHDSETGWWALNRRHPEARAFMNAFKTRYDTDLVYTDQPHSYDCTTFDIVRREFEEKGAKTFNIAASWHVSHHYNPFLHGPTGKYMRHALGPERKKSADGTLAKDYETFTSPLIIQIKTTIKKIIGRK